MISEEKVLALVEEEKKKFEEQLKKPTIMILGPTGCGKSTLINTIFGVDVAKTCVGAAGTKGFDMYEDENINLIDSEGWETDIDYTKYISDLKNYVSELKAKGKFVNCIWYCISAEASRIQESDIDILQEITQIDDFSKKLCVVITKCDEDDVDGNTAKTFIDEINKYLPHIQCFQVSNNDNLNKELDMDELLKWSSNTMDDEALADMFCAAQTLNVDSKAKKARNHIMAYTATAAAIGASPIPFSQSIPLTALQVQMMSHIGKLYGFRFFDNMADTGAKTVISQTGKFIAQFLSKTVVAELVKFIPGIGTIAGGATNAVVAASITYGIGIATSKQFEKAYRAVLKGEKLESFNVMEMFKDDEFRQIVSENMTKYTNEHKNKPAIEE